MIKKYKLSLYLLAVVMMLSIYYINMPEETSLPTTSPDVVTKYAEFAATRIEILEQRELLVAEYEAVIASSDTSTTEKNTAYLSMQEILELTENEVLVETFVMDLGYLDCLTQYEDGLITIQILNYVHSVEETLEIFMIASSVFDKDVQVFVKPVTI